MSIKFDADSEGNIIAVGYKPEFPYSGEEYGIDENNWREKRLVKGDVQKVLALDYAKIVENIKDEKALNHNS